MSEKYTHVNINKDIKSDKRDEFIADDVIALESDIDFPLVAEMILNAIDNAKTKTISAIIKKYIPLYTSAQIHTQSKFVRNLLNKDIELAKSILKEISSKWELPFFSTISHPGYIVLNLITEMDHRTRSYEESEILIELFDEAVTFGKIEGFDLEKVGRDLCNFHSIEYYIESYDEHSFRIFTHMLAQLDAEEYFLKEQIKTTRMTDEIPSYIKDYFSTAKVASYLFKNGCEWINKIVSIKELTKVSPQYFVS